MTLLQFHICDHCSQQIVGPSTPYRVGEGPTLDICASCQKKPFRQVQPSPRAEAIKTVVKMALESRTP